MNKCCYALCFDNIIKDQVTLNERSINVIWITFVHNFSQSSNNLKKKFDLTHKNLFCWNKLMYLVWFSSITIQFKTIFLTWLKTQLNLVNLTSECYNF